MTTAVLRRIVLAASFAIAFVGLIACDPGNNVENGSGIRPGTPAPTQLTTPSPAHTQVPTPTVIDPTGAPSLTPPATATQSPNAPIEPTATARNSSPTETPDVLTPEIPTPHATSTPPVSPTTGPETAPLQPMNLERVFSWYSPARPTHFAEAPDGSGRIFVSEQSGRLVEITGAPTDADGTQRVVLDIRQRVTGRANEEGLLGFALHPEFATNNRLFVYYSATNPRRSVISEFLFLSDGTVDTTSERTIMEITQPQSNHNGGMLVFGPDDYLYISVGDGGGSGDRSNNAQDISNVLGSILRIDVDSPGQPYVVPEDNPLVGQSGAAPEIWAYGLRNPWRITFDQETGDLWAGDVGQNRVEEIDLIVRGGNYGWRLKEGEECFNPSSGCERADLIDPVVSYSHAFGCSVSGGYVFKHGRLPSLQNAYIYADFCSGIVWALRHSDGQLIEQAVLADTSHQIPAFGQTLDGEVYVLTYSPGIYRFVNP